MVMLWNKSFLEFVLTILYALSLCAEPQRNQSVDYCSNGMVGSYIIEDLRVTYVKSVSLQRRHCTVNLSV